MHPGLHVNIGGSAGQLAYPPHPGPCLVNKIVKAGSAIRDADIVVSVSLSDAWTEVERGEMLIKATGLLENSRLLTNQSSAFSERLAHRGRIPGWKLEDHPPGQFQCAAGQPTEVACRSHHQDLD